ncbi:hypothetical protein AMTR_s00189p00031860 [Amborella trichopoda]|uniref:Aminotransferase-like plant mobile domain-containing protein n=1 Tax=Amborella trichopoda TaxID=13333 RepID=U5DDD6_AMBTC|nr:hypothetical protein AMTR_s00189p00031860 [Amborella trichopoda]
MVLFGEFLFVDRSKGRAHLLVVWATRQLDYLEQVAWGPAIVGWLHYHLCSVARGDRYLGVVQSSFRSGHGSTSPYLTLFSVDWPHNSRRFISGRIECGILRGSLCDCITRCS